MSAECVKSYGFRIGYDGEIIGQDDDRPDQEIDRLVRLKMRTNGVDYEEGFRQVRADPDCRAAIKSYAAS
jgi:hypothetical protein